MSDFLMQDPMQKNKEEMRQEVDSIVKQKEIRNVYDLDTDKLTEEQRKLHNLEDAKKESLAIGELLHHRNELNLTNAEHRNLVFRYNRDKNLILMNNKKMFGDSKFMTAVKDAMRDYEKVMREALESEYDGEFQTEDALTKCQLVIDACDAYLKRGPSFFFWRRERYREVMRAKSRFQSELKAIKSMQKKVFPDNEEDFRAGDTLLSVLSSGILTERNEARKKAAEKKKNRKEEVTIKEVSEETLQKENENLALKIGSFKVVKNYAKAPSQTIEERRKRFGAKFEKKEKKTEADKKELRRKTKEKKAFTKADTMEKDRLDELLRQCGADDYPELSLETKRRVAALMGDDMAANKALLKNYAKDGVTRENAIYTMLDRFMQIDTKDVDLSSTDAMIKQSERLEKMLDATNAMVILIRENRDIEYRMPDAVKTAIKNKLSDIQNMTGIYRSRKYLAMNKLYSESLDSELSLNYDPNRTDEQYQLQLLMGTDLYNPVYAYCFEDSEEMPEEFPEDSEEVNKVKETLVEDMGIGADHEFQKGSPIGLEDSKHYETVQPLTDKLSKDELYVGFVQDSLQFEEDKCESVVRHIANLTNLKPVEYMSKEELESLMHRFIVRDTGDMTEEQKKKTVETRNQAYREMRDIMLAHVNYVMEKYGNGYLYMNIDDFKKHSMEVAKDFHCCTNIGQFLGFCLRHKELFESKKDEMNIALEYVNRIQSFNMQVRAFRNGAVVDKKKGDKANMNKALAESMMNLITENLGGENSLVGLGFKNQEEVIKKPDKVNWDCKYEDKFQHKEYSKEEIEKLKAECRASHAHLKVYQEMEVRQGNIAKYNETEVFALKSLIELKKDSSVKLTEKEVKNLSVLSRYLDKAGFEKIFNLYTKKDKDENGLKTAKDGAITVIKPVLSEGKKSLDGVVEELKKKNEGLVISNVSAVELKRCYRSVFIVESLKELFPDLTLTKDEEDYVKQASQLQSVFSSEDMLFQTMAYRAYTTDLIEHDIKAVEEKKAKQKKA